MHNIKVQTRGPLQDSVQIFLQINMQNTKFTLIIIYLDKI